ncbi:DUF2250 domain-containing protein [Halorubrum sp. JWXQ-INN 858]|uniref:DUF2250 domain-containing protein n=1 Tax=Halorubrum sp. JWXQ-INN 858 TaxID=2690782 RepID=UPI00135CF083|nr:DUF2250 domain-containing protein [Halorubrum sp. JWXQ-INN 858]MWV63809.1 DUF2250 domain-containing protein [Halorubrum sp. JWXQ-INN 858]
MSTSDPRDVAPSCEDANADVTGIVVTRSDARALAYLVESGADYPALIAGNTGLHVAYVERRLTTMAEAGLVEEVSGEVVYRITTAGRDALDDRRAAGR